MENTLFAPSNPTLLLFKHEFNNNFTSIKSKRKRINLTRTTEPKKDKTPEILFISSYPNRECGIATYCQDLLHAIEDKFGTSFSLKVCALEGTEKVDSYPEEVKYVLQTNNLAQYYDIAQQINEDRNISMVFIQHEFGLFSGEYGDYFLQLLSLINKPVITTFHTVLPNPDFKRREVVRAIADLTDQIIVMTEMSATILKKEYNVPADKIVVIHHGTHLVAEVNKPEKNHKNYFGNRLVLSTFGLLNAGKSIETALEALPLIIEKFPNLLYLIIGKTHPNVVKKEGEIYRDFLQEKVIELGLQNHVRFINKYLELEDLLDYLQRTDIYLFTSKDPFQAVSGTFAYAMASGCPIISTPIPHAKEMLNDGAGIIVDFQEPQQLADATIKLLFDPVLLAQMKLNGLHKIASTSWQNSAIAHVELINQHLKNKAKLKYKLPLISLEHIKRLTTDKGMIQFSKIATPDLESGYTLDDNARALIAVAEHYKLTKDIADLPLLDTYLNLIIFCQQEDGSFLNYVDIDGNYFEKNKDENLEDSNGRAIWALGEFLSIEGLFNQYFIERTEYALNKSLKHITTLSSPRAIAFAIKGLHHYNLKKDDIRLRMLITSLADNLVSKYRGVSDSEWEWFEDSLTYANSLIPEAMLYAYLSTGNELYSTIAVATFDFLLSILFKEDQIKVISNQGWHTKGKISNKYGEQPIDVAYTILALSKFYEVFKNKEYSEKMSRAFEWFLGKNHLRQIIYNPCTGGCYDGLEENHVNLNQGAESTVSYLLSRLAIEKFNLKHSNVMVDEALEEYLFAE